MSDKDMKFTRGERNCNPGNIREYAQDGTHWRGERATNDDPAFEEFTTPAWGIRALARVLLTYQRKYGLETIEDLINRWAPPSENDTGAYVDSVCKQFGGQADSKLDLENRAVLAALVRAIIHHENGRVIYSDITIKKGVDLA